MIPILITGTLCFMLGSLIGMFLTVLCQAVVDAVPLTGSLTLIPIEAGEPRLDSQCLIQTKEDGNHLLIAEHADDGWTLTDYPGIKHFTVTAWCYLPEPIRR